jgi:hypothetical protein
MMGYERYAWFMTDMAEVALWVDVLVFYSCICICQGTVLGLRAGDLG